ncbi:MAG TPA: hypothetical protein VD837_17160 [Terriglobales bacterium]|nr:hypothetical protein [Terriglobales bacterium]
MGLREPWPEKYGDRPADESRRLEAVAARSNAGGGGRTKWIIVGAALACVVIGVVIAAAVTSRDDGDVRSTKKEISTPTDVGAFLANPKVRESVGAIVFFNDLFVKPEGTVYFAKDRGGKEIVVVLNDAKTDIPKDGTLADVSGVVASVPSISAMRKQWKLDKRLAERIRKDSVYIEAERVRPERQKQAKANSADQS